MSNILPPSSFSLHQRFTHQGTLTERAGVPEPRFALQATVYWIRALAMLAKGEPVNWASMQRRYSKIQKSSMADAAKNTVFEQLLMSINHLSALRAMDGACKPVDLARTGIVTWYYGIYHAASAMVTAQDGSSQDTHAETANVWDRQLATRGLISSPFELRLSTLVEVDVRAELASLSVGGVDHLVHKEPNSLPEAKGACISYLKGSASYFRWLICEGLMEERDFKTLNVVDFRTKAARALRDRRLQGRTLGFVHQAFRFRGKANYREALYISYGDHIGTHLDHFLADMSDVLEAFLVMAGAFCARRIGMPEWTAYTNDLNSNLPLAIKPSAIWQ